MLYSQTKTFIKYMHLSKIILSNTFKQQMRYLGLVRKFNLFKNQVFQRNIHIAHMWTNFKQTLFLQIFKEEGDGKIKWNPGNLTLKWRGFVN